MAATMTGLEFSITGSTEEARNSIVKLTNALNKAKNALSGTGGSANNTARDLKNTGNAAAKAASGGLGKFLSSLKRIAMYRMIRGIISGITQALKEGISNMYEYSRVAGTEFKGAMDTAKSAMTTWKNSLAAMLAPIIEWAIPYLQMFIEWIVKLNNTIGAFFAGITGKKTYSAAIWYQDKYTDSVQSTTKAVKELRAYLAPFDELNVLPSDNSSGGGGSSTPDYSKMFEERDVPEWATNVGDFLEEIKGIFTDFWNWLSQLDFVEAIQKGWNTFGEWLREKIENLGELMGGVPQWVEDWLDALFPKEVEVPGPETVLVTGESEVETTAIHNMYLRSEYKAAAENAIANQTSAVSAPNRITVGGSVTTVSPTVMHSTYLRNEYKAAVKDAIGDTVSVEGPQTINITGKPTFNVLFGEDSNPSAALEKQLGVTLNNGHATTLSDGTVVSSTIYQGGSTTTGTGTSSIFNTGGSSALTADEALIAILAGAIVPEALLGGSASTAAGLADATIWDDIDKALKEHPLTIDVEGNLTKATDKTDGSTKVSSVAEFIKTAFASGWTYPNVWTIAQFVSTAFKSGWTYPELYTIAKLWAYMDGLDYYPVLEALAKFMGWTTDSTTPMTSAKKDTPVSDYSQHGGGGHVVLASGGIFAGGAWHDIAAYARGGLPGGGQMFIAREAGPELVGTLKGHTAVMNNDQIVASVSAGVARAISNIEFHMRGASSYIPTYAEDEETEEAMYRAFVRAWNEVNPDGLGGDVYLDGEQLYRNVVKHNRQNTRATGVNAMA